MGELVDPEDVRFVEFDTGVEDATNVGLEKSCGRRTIVLNALRSL